MAKTITNTLKLSPTPFVFKICHQHWFQFSLATMFGNFIVLNAFVRNEKLRTINNLYIMNLSAADFCIGLGKFFTKICLTVWLIHFYYWKNHKSLHEFFYNILTLRWMEIRKLHMWWNGLKLWRHQYPYERSKGDKYGQLRLFGLWALSYGSLRFIWHSQ